MLKTIYSKYLFSFILLLGLGFLTIALIISSVVTSYSMSNKEEIMSGTARSVFASIKSEMDEKKCDFSQAVTNKTLTENEFMLTLTEISDSTIIIIDGVGNVLLQSGKNKIPVNRIKSENLESIRTNSEKAKLSDLDGLFKNRRFNYICPVKNSEDDLMGYIILTSSSAVLRNVNEQIIRSLIIASLWVFLAAIIVVYFITDRITTPIKQMSKAVKAYSKGDFKVRIPVKGSDEIATLSQAFNTMAESLESFESTRGTFISSVSHDLKTPMTSIQGFIEGIMDGTIPPEKQDYYLNIILKEVKRLTRLVNTLLDVSRMESGVVKLNPSYFDVCEISRLILISFEEKIEDNKINIEFDADEDPSNVYADKDSIYQVIYNIVGNALKFTDSGGTIRISIKRQKSLGKYSVTIFNTGIGIKQEDLPLVFDRFFKTDPSRGLDRSGTGLGLYISKSKIEAHGEKISVDSKYGEYCSFTFTLPDNQKDLEKVLFNK